MRQLFFLPLLSIILSACTGMPMQTAIGTDTVPMLDNSIEPGSLFSSDANILSDDAIERILGYQWRPDNRARIAVLPFGSEYWFGWSEELTEAATAMQNRLTDRLSDSTAILHAAYLPSILAPSERSVARLREAAARYQADLMLIYRSQCHSFEKYRFLSRDRARARCTIEALLLDTRTGLVPLSLASSQSFEAAKSDQDLNFRETILRSQLEATARALDEIADELVVFLND